MREKILSGLVVAVCSISALQAVPALAQNAADTPATSSSGATFTAPKAWTLHNAAPVVVLDAPEADTHIAIVSIPQAASGTAAVMAAWQLYRPGQKHPVNLVTPRPARNGWEERQVVDYETSPNEHLAIQAIALRKGTGWTVLLLDGSESTLEKRGAAVGLVASSLRPAGYSRESFAGRVPHPLDAARIEALRSFVETSIGELGVPGAAIALTDHGRLVYEGGVGVRTLGKPEPVDAHTLFMVASNTKGMSTLLLSELVDEGKLHWDDPVTSVYPAFRLGSDATTAKVKIRNLVCACTGLPRKDFEWLFNTVPGTPASTTFDQLAATEPTSGFGEVFQYNNLMASAAGYIGGHLVYPKREIGAAYDAAMQAKIFTPLGMTETTFSTARALAADHASPHGDDVDGHPSVATQELNLTIMPYRPAGGAWSSAHDMIKYVQDELTQGVLPNGKRLVSAENLLARRTRGVPTGEDTWYGMGLEENDVWGVPVIHHGGSMGGYKTDIMLIPDAQIGAVILTNADNGQALLRPFMRRLLEIVYDGKLEAAGDVAAAAARRMAGIAAERKRLVVPPAPAEAAALAGHYASPELGKITIERSASGTVFRFPAWSSAVASRKNDDGTLSFITIDPTNNGFEFVGCSKDGKRTLTTRDGQHAYLFTESGS